MRIVVAALSLSLTATAVATTSASGQEQPVPLSTNVTSTTVLPDVSAPTADSTSSTSTSTTAPESGTAPSTTALTTSPTTGSTTTVVGEPLPAEAQMNASEVGGSGGSYSNQAPFDPSSTLAIAAKVAAADALVGRARKDVASAQRRLAEAESHHGEVVAALRDGEAAAGRLSARRRSLLDEAVELRGHVRRAVVNAFVVGPEVDLSAMADEDAAMVGHGKTMLDAVIRVDLDEVRRLHDIEERLTSPEKRIVDGIDDAEQAVVAARSDLDAARLRLLAAVDEQEVWASGSHVYVPGFVFPVDGPVQFTDTWGAPRMPGTAQAHWHEGTDVFAAAGTPLVAVEAGVVTTVGSVGLGGLRIWLTGQSGTRFYYAHLQSVAPGIEPGTTVSAGQLVGTVGNTGNAATTPSHLHFEVHPDGGDAVDPYPLLIRSLFGRPD